MKILKQKPTLTKMTKTNPKNNQFFIRFYHDTTITKPNKTQVKKNANKNRSLKKTFKTALSSSQTMPPKPVLEPKKPTNIHNLEEIYAQAKPSSPNLIPQSSRQVSTPIAGMRIVLSGVRSMT